MASIMKELSNDLSRFVDNRGLNFFCCLSFIIYLVVARAANKGWAITSYTNNKAISERYSTLITPADWNFRMWSVIGIGELISIYCLVMYSDHEADLFKKIFSLVNIFQSLWLLLFTRQYIILSSITLLLISISLKFALDAIQFSAIISSWSTRMILLCIGPVKLHFAFSLIASGLNLNVLVVSTMINCNIHKYKQQIEYYFAQLTLWSLALFSLFQIIYFSDTFFSFITIWGLAAISDKAKHKKIRTNTENRINQSIELTCLLIISLLSLTGLFVQFGPKLSLGKLVSERNVVSSGETMVPLLTLLLFILTFHIVIGHSILKRPFEPFSKSN